MKKVLTYFIFMLSLLSCWEKVEMPDVAPSGISFAAPSIAETKSVLITDVDNLKTGEDERGYSVFASRYLIDESADHGIGDHQVFMRNAKVYSSTRTVVNGDAVWTNWRYDDADADTDGNQKVYWAPSAVHKFFAVYPYYDKTSDAYDFGISYAINEAVHALEVKGKHAVDGNTTYICTGIDEAHDNKNLCPDILYGVQSYPEPYQVGEDREPVKFTLSHALSAVSFKIRNASEYGITSVATQAITGFENASEYVRLSENGPVWGPLHTVGGHTFKVPDIETIASGAYYPSGNDYWYTALMIPQNFGTKATSPSFSFRVTFSNSTEHAFSFLPGYHYVYNINVTSKVISCNLEVAPWIEDEPIKLN